MTVKQMWQRCVKHSLVVLGHSQTGAGPLSFGRLGQRSNVSFIVALLVMCAVQHAGAAILFEDYRGTNASPTAVSTVPTVPADYYVNGPEPAAPNGFVPLDVKSRLVINALLEQFRHPRIPVLQRLHG